MTLDPKEFRLYPRKPRQRIRDESKAWSIAFKRVMHYARMSRKKRGASRSGSARPRKRFNQRCAVRVIYSRNKTAGQWRAHGRYIMRESARGRSSAPTAFTGDQELADLSATLGDWINRVFAVGIGHRRTDGLPELPLRLRRPLHAAFCRFHTIRRSSGLQEARSNRSHRSTSVG